MLITSGVLDGIRNGTVSLAFRRWRRPSVRTGGTLLTPAGQLQILTVVPVAEGAITDEEARRAGYKSRGALVEELNRRSVGDLYRIEFGELLPDPRLQLRDAIPEGRERESVLDRLDRLDGFAVAGPWTRPLLEAVAVHPGTRAADLSDRVGFETEVLKRNIRKLKNLGLTISLGTGYRLSPRGEVILAALRHRGSGAPR